MRIFVTGGTGYVGRNLLPRLVNENHEVTCLIRSPAVYSDNDPFKKCRLIKGDVTDIISLKDTMRGMDIVIHLAVATPLTSDRDDYNAFYRTNVLGTENVLSECLISKVKLVLCFSSTAAIGISHNLRIDENTPTNPESAYGSSKKEADDVILSFYQKCRLPVVTLCFPHIYGPGDRYEFLKIVRMIKKGILPQIGFNPNLLPSVYITDAINAILLGIEKGKAGEKYLIADDNPHDIRDIRKYVLINLGINRKFYPIIPKHISIFGAYLLEYFFGLIGAVPPIRAINIKSITSGRRLHIEKARKDLGFKPDVGLEEGIRKTIDWYINERLL